MIANILYGIISTHNVISDGKKALKSKEDIIIFVLCRGTAKSMKFIALEIFVLYSSLMLTPSLERKGLGTLEAFL